MKILGVVITLLFILMTLVGTYQIVTRYFFNRPSTISEELLTYSFTWMSLLASAYVFGKRDHMRMGFMADKLTGPARRYLEIFIDTLSFFFAAVVMVYGGISITRLTMIQITASLRISMGWIYIIVPIAGLLIMVFSVMNAVDMLHKDCRLQASGRRTGHSGRQHSLRLQARRARLWLRRPDAAPHRCAQDAPAYQQPRQARGTGGIRSGDYRECTYRSNSQ